HYTRIHVAPRRHIILAERSAARLTLWNLHHVLSPPGHSRSRLELPGHWRLDPTTTRSVPSEHCTKSCIRQHRLCLDDKHPAQTHARHTTRQVRIPHLVAYFAQLADRDAGGARLWFAIVCTNCIGCPH